MVKRGRADRPHPPYANFCLNDKGLDPDKITRMFRRKPDESFRRGDRRGADHTWSHGFWMLGSKGHVRSLDPVQHLRWLVEEIDSFRSQLRRVLKDKGIKAYISCFWIMPSSNEGLVLEPELLKRIAALDVQLWLDIYGPD